MFNSSYLSMDWSGLVTSGKWSYIALVPQLITLFILTLIIMIVSISYNKKLKHKDQLHEPRGLVLCVEIVVKAIERMVIEMLGYKYKNLTVYFLYLLLYIMVGNTCSILGFSSPMTSYTVVLCLGLVTFFGIYYFGLKYQKLAYFKKYIFNPLELIQQFVPLVSITFRIFGNVVGGGIILDLLYYFTSFIWSHVPIFGPIDMFALIILPWFHIYFDLFDDTIQAYIFTILTLIYWQSEMNHTIKKKNKNFKQKEIVDFKRETTLKKVQLQT